jgi:hypothetical protein
MNRLVLYFVQTLYKLVALCFDKITRKKVLWADKFTCATVHFNFASGRVWASYMTGMLEEVFDQAEYVQRKSLSSLWSSSWALGTAPSRDAIASDVSTTRLNDPRASHGAS